MQFLEFRARGSVYDGADGIADTGVWCFPTEGGSVAVDSKTLSSHALILIQKSESGLQGLGVELEYLQKLDVNVILDHTLHPELRSLKPGLRD